MSASTAPPSEAPPTAAAYVYGVAARGTVSAIAHDGVAGAAVTVVEHGDLVALVSPVPRRPLRARRRDLVNHLRVLEHAFEQATIVPCAFGTVLPSASAVRRDLLDARSEELHGLLRRLDGLAQLNVRAHYDEALLLREIVAADPALAALSARTRALGDAGYYDRIRLGELVAAAVAARRERDAGALHARLARFAADVVLEEPGEAGVLKASFLVARRSLDDFDRELLAVAGEHGRRMRLESIGPLPPTAFARLEDGRWGF
jgi:hypothetical protein